MKNTGAAITSGIAAGAVMSAGMMTYMLVRGRSIWTMPNLIAAMWLGDRVATGEFSSATVAGFLTHMVTSALMGWIATPFIRDLSRSRTMLASLSYALASYPAVFAAVLSWANPLMFREAELIPMTVAHALFGIVMGGVYIRLRRWRAVTES